MSLLRRLFGHRVKEEPVDPRIAQQKVKSDATLRASQRTLHRVEELLDEHKEHDARLASYRRTRLHR